MRSFPLFTIKYTPRHRCKLHKAIQEKVEAQEREYQKQRMAEEENDNSGEEEAQSSQAGYQALKLIENESGEVVNDDDEDEEDVAVDKADGEGSQ